MEAALSFSNPEPFRLEFNMTESRDGTQEKPVLYYSRNGFTFRADLDLFNNTVTVSLDTKRDQSLERDWKVLEGEVQKLAEEELDKRRAAYGTEHFSV